MQDASSKIYDLDALAIEVARQRAAGKCVVHCHGVFDLLHVGHIRHFQEARHFGDLLVVTLTQDQYVNKGPNRPAFPQALRAEQVAALSMVDYVAVNRWPTAVETISLLRPSIYAKGSEYREANKDVTGGISLEAQAAAAAGTEIRFTEDLVFSSSTLINRHLSPFSDSVNQYLEGFRQRHSPEEVLGWLDKLAALRPVVLGEAIIDEYLYCEAIGKSSKDPMLAVIQNEVEAFAGGSLAVANHLAAFCPEVFLITQVGSRDRAEEFIRAALSPNVKATLLTKVDAPTVHKRRVVERYSGNKLIELYRMDDRLPSEAEDAEILAALRRDCQGTDLTVVADFGHGLLTPQTIAWLAKEVSYLAVMAQSNAGNRGFNPISKYPRADYLCLASHEVMLETRQRNQDMRAGTLELARRIACPRFTVTMGKAGSLHYEAAHGFTEAPALATRVLDRVGAGDAVLAVTALLTKLGAPWEIVAFLGNVAGAQLVAELGNRRPLNRVSLSKYVIALLK